MQTFVAVGHALLAIRDHRLYRADYATFEDYCRVRWRISKTHANRLIDSAEVAENLTPLGVMLPTNEAQARPLAQLPPEEHPGHTIMRPHDPPLDSPRVRDYIPIYSINSQWRA